jgi:hypothetical protein
MIMAGATISLTWVGAVLSPGAITQHESSRSNGVPGCISWILAMQKQSTRHVQAAQQAMRESEERLRPFISTHH